MFKAGKSDLFFCGLLLIVLAFQVFNLSRRGDFVTFEDLDTKIQASYSQFNSISRDDDKDLKPCSVSAPVREKLPIPSGVTTFRAGDEWCIYYSGVIFSAGDISPFDVGRILVIRPNLITTEVADYSGGSRNESRISNIAN